MTRAPTHDDERAQSAIVGIVLLVAVVAIGSTGILLVGLDATDRTSDRVKDEQAERAFVTLDKRMDTVARQESGSRDVELGLDNDDSALRKEETGRIVVRTSESNTEILNTSIGAIEYEQSDTTLAYQGGGVWRGTGADAQMVSSPDITYQDASLSLPLTTMTGEEELSTDPISIEKSQTPSFTEYDLVEGEVVVIEITSQYYGGWAQYFREEVDNTGVTVDHANETVIVELGQFQPPSGAFDDGVSATGDIGFGGGSPHIDGDVSASGSVDDSNVNGNVTEGEDSDLAPMDRIIERKVEQAEENGSITRLSRDLSGVSTLQGGQTYYAPNGIDLTSGTVTANVASGNITLIVNGSVHLEGGDIVVTNHGGTNNALRTYATGNFSMKNSEYCVAPCGGSTDADHNHLYGTSEMQVGMAGGSTYFEGALYAPRHDEFVGNNAAWDRVSSSASKCDRNATDDYDVCLATGSSSFDGSIVAGSTKLAQSTEINHDSSLDGTSPVYEDDQTALPPEVTYFTITVYEVEVTDGDDEDN